MGNSEEPRHMAGLKIGLMGKGGAGNSTVAALLSWQLVERGYEVCLIDADSTNIGLHRALGVEQAPVPLIEYYGGMVFRGRTCHWNACLEAIGRKRPHIFICFPPAS